MPLGTVKTRMIRALRRMRELAGGRGVNDATDYLLGEMEPERAADFERALADDAALRAEVEALRPVVTRLERCRPRAGTRPSPPPLQLPGPAASRGAAPRAPARAAPGGRGAVRGRAARGGRRPRRAARPRPGARRRGSCCAPIGGARPGASGRVGVVGRPRQRARRAACQPTGDGQFYELWLLGADKQLVGLGSFRVDDDGTATLKLPLPVDPGAFTLLRHLARARRRRPGHSGVSVLRGPTI